MLTLERPKVAPTQSKNVFFLPPDEPLFEAMADQTIRYLKSLASFRKVPKYSRLSKAQLLAALED